MRRALTESRGVVKRSAITRKTPLKKKRGTSTAKLKRDALKGYG